MLLVDVDIPPKISVIEDNVHCSPPTRIRCSTRATLQKGMPQPDRQLTPNAVDLIWVESTVFESVRTKVVTVGIEESSFPCLGWQEQTLV